MIKLLDPKPNRRRLMSMNLNIFRMKESVTHKIRPKEIIKKSLTNWSS